jgi:Uri superfamily endonuclease
MPDYQKSKIYKIYSPSKNIIYIGSTIQSLSQRLGEHLSKYKAYNKDNTKNYIRSFLVLECEDYKIELLEEYACNNKQQLLKKEGEYIRNIECCNKIIVGRTPTEYKREHRINNKEFYNDYMKQYRKNNADKMREYDRQRYLQKKV